MDLFLLWIILAIVIGVIAGARGRSGFGWFLISVLLSPLIGLILVALLPSLKDRPTPATHVKCPDCAELVRNEARVCKHCGCRLVSQVDAKPAASATLET